MKKVFTKALFALGFLLAANYASAQSPNLQGKAMAAANQCIQSFDLQGLGLKTVTQVEQVGTCPDGTPKYAVTIYKVGHCPQNNMIACLVIAAPVATVTFDCAENVESIVCFN